MMLQLVAALASAGAILLFGLFTVRSRQYVRPSERRLTGLQTAPQAARHSLSWEEVRRRGPSSLPVLRDWLLQSAWARRMATDLEAAGLSLRVGEYMLVRIVAAIGGFVAVAFIGQSSAAVLMGLVVGFLAFMAPAFWVRAVRRRRVETITRQLPEATQMISNSMRAGFAFQHGVQLVSEQLESPVADEFVRLVLDLNVGSSVEDALHGMLKRCDTEEMNLLVTAVLVQRTSGGNLSEILDNVGDQLREKERLVGEVRTMTAQQRFSGTVLTFWPILLLGFFCLLNWDSTKLLFTTSEGRIMLVGAGLLQFLGYLTIQKILDIEV